MLYTPQPVPILTILWQIAKSEVVPKSLSPQWLGVDVPFEKLRGAKQLKVEVTTYYSLSSRSSCGTN